MVNTMTAQNELMSTLFLADPETASMVQEKLSHRQFPVTENALRLIVDETIWGLSQETAFGHAVADGLIELAGKVSPDQLAIFCSRVRKAGARNVAIGRLMALHLAPVLKTGHAGLIAQFDKATLSLLKIGNYTLGSPLETLSDLLKSNDIASGIAFLQCIGRVLSPELSYNQSKHLCHVLSLAARSFTPSRRHFQIQALMRVAETDTGLVDGFLDGMQRGASLLDDQALSCFVSDGLIRYHRDKAAGGRFLSLASQQARERVDALQAAASFSEMQHGLNRYLQARIGSGLSVRPLSEISNNNRFSAEIPLVYSQGNRMYLPDEIDIYPSRVENRFLYKCLTRLEACYHEFGTYEFDLEKAMDACRELSVYPSASEILEPSPLPSPAATDAWVTDAQAHEPLPDMILFCRMFPNPDLAKDLLTIFENGRIRIILESDYPGIVRQSLPVLIREADRMYSGLPRNHPLETLYLCISLGIHPEFSLAVWSTVAEAVAAAFFRHIDQSACVEDCAAFLWASYSRIESCLHTASPEIHPPLRFPFGWELHPNVAIDPVAASKAAVLKHKLAEKGISVYKSDIRKLLADNAGKISKDDLRNLRQKSQDRGASQTADPSAAVSIDFSDPDFSDIASLMDAGAVYDTLPASWYREWDSRHGDYLHHHVRVVDRIVEGANTGFYDRTLNTYRELVSQIRYAFELMKPQGLKILRNWIEGDELDYRAVLDFVLDKKAGRMPSDRLYIKRIKHERNVAVLLLVDLSRSTGNSLENNPSGIGATVLDIEKEAMVMFCEALGILGDSFAIAGFSGTGRLSVDYTHVKEFDEPLNDAVRRRISGLTPQRNTRMGAAVRHATAMFETIPATIRLMVILGDGFPNDVDYKQDYAIGDTRKAIGEALSRGIHTHAITVNMQNDARLDDLYGNVHHNVISDVRELPARLVRIYGALTRSRPETS